MVTPLLSGFLVTILILVTSAVLSLVLAIPLGVIFGRAGAAVDNLIRTYIELFRGTSVLVQLFYAYYVLPLAGIYLPALTTAVLVLTLNTAAYGTEIVRSSIGAIAYGQREAASALGLRPLHTFLFVLLPQAIPTAVASYATLIVDLMKVTPLVAFVTVRDLSFEAKSLYQTYGHPTLLYSFLLAAYYFVGVTILTAGRYIVREFEFFRGERKA